MTDWSGLERQREEQTDVLVQSFDCKACKGENTVEEECLSGVYVGICANCGEKYLNPDWDAMGKELV